MLMDLDVDLDEERKKIRGRVWGEGLYLYPSGGREISGSDLIDSSD
jgi:hypothetical protein